MNWFNTLPWYSQALMSICVTFVAYRISYTVFEAWNKLDRWLKKNGGDK